MFGLDLTIASGSKFQDPGDGASRGHNLPFPLLADAKYTERSSRSVSLRELQKLDDEATMVGKRAIMPLRFYPPNTVGPQDYVVLKAHDLRELLNLLEG